MKDEQDIPQPERDITIKLSFGDEYSMEFMVKNNHVTDGYAKSTEAYLNEITDNKQWREQAEFVVKNNNPLPFYRDTFCSHWIERGHRIREQINDDALLCVFLRCMLPPYHGDAVTLYRGENKKRWSFGKVGLAWTPCIETAKMFARGLNSVNSGGVLLKGYFPAAAIISEPNAHSRYLSEEQFTVDPIHAENIEVIQDYPASHYE